MFLKKIVLILITVTSLFIMNTVQAQTLGDLKSELNDMEKNLNENEQKKELTEEQIEETENKVVEIKANIEQIYSDIDTLNNEIEQLNKDIESRDKEIKEVINFVQVSNGESAYLEYLFGAKDFTDFIYRLVVSEQMTNYNEQLIDDYNQMIVDNNNKKEQLANNEKQLQEKQEELNVELDKLGEELDKISDTSISIQEEIDAQKEIIQMYEDKGCSENQDLSSCGTSILPANTAFYRPLISGVVTSEWGSRWGSFHEGIDLSNSVRHIPVYSIGTGVVASTISQSSCGGNMVIAHYTVNGATYTVVYAHLYSISVSPGQVLTRDTQVGLMGGGSDTMWYDGCTTGDHLHLSISSGLYGIDYTSWSTLVSYSINPRYMINFPSYSWADRYTQY